VRPRAAWAVLPWAVPGQLAERRESPVLDAEHIRAALLEDPEGRLRGDGLWMRHIQVKAPADLDRPELRAFLRAACAEADHSPSTARKATILSIVKRAKPSKGRLGSGREKLVRAKAGPR